MTIYRGKVLVLDSGIVAACLEQRKRGWSCLVIGGHNQTYKPGGFDIFVLNEDLEAGREWTLDIPKELL